MQSWTRPMNMWDQCVQSGEPAFRRRPFSLPFVLASAPRGRSGCRGKCRTTSSSPRWWRAFPQRAGAPSRTRSELLSRPTKFAERVSAPRLGMRRAEARSTELRDPSVLDIKMCQSSKSVPQRALSFGQLVSVSAGTQ